VKGRGISRCLAKSGHNIILTYNSNVDAANENKAFIEENFSVKCAIVKADFIDANKESVAAIFDVIKQNSEFQKSFVGFVHNAGGYRHPPGERPSIEFAQLYQNWYVNTFLLLIEESIKLWETTEASERSAIAISSPGCNLSCPPYVSYLQPGIGKSSMEYLVRIYAKDLRPKGIRVNTVIPGYVRTDAWDPVLAAPGAPEQVESRMKETTMGDWIPTEEIGDLVDFLVSNKSKSITGQHFYVDRGLHLST